MTCCVSGRCFRVSSPLFLGDVSIEGHQDGRMVLFALFDVGAMVVVVGRHLLIYRYILSEFRRVFFGGKP